MFLKKIFFLFLISAVLFNLASCKDEDPAGPIENPTYEDGVFVINQGPFQNGSGSLSFYSRKTGDIHNDIYQNANNRVQLGNIVQSMAFHNGLAYIVVNNANKIVIANAKTFEKIGEITGFELPRYFLPIDENTAYVSQWGADGVSGSIKVIDLKTNAISNTIATRPGPESMIKIDDFVYVTNSGGFTADSVVSKIEIANETVIKTIEVGFGPDFIVADKNGDLWTIGHGNYLTYENGALTKIANDNPEFSIETILGTVGITINDSGDQLYLIQNERVFQHSITENSLSQTPLISRSFFNIGFDTETEEIMALDTKDFSQSGQMLIYDLNGSALDSMQVGVVPGGFWFD